MAKGQSQEAGDNSTLTQVGRDQNVAQHGGVIQIHENAARERVELIQNILKVIFFVVVAVTAFFTNPSADKHISQLGRGAFKSYRLDREFFYDNYFLWSNVYVIGDKGQHLIFSWGAFGKIMETADYNYNQQKLGDLSKSVPETLIPPLPPAATKEDREKRDFIIAMLAITGSLNDAFDGSDPNDSVVAKQLVSKFTLASTLHTNQKPEDAIRELSLAVTLRENALGENHPLVGKTLAHLAQAYLNANKPEEAKATIDRAKKILKK